MNEPLTAAAQLLWKHWQAGTKIDALPTALRPANRAQGLAVQAGLPAAGGRSVLGWKIAATSGVGQAHIGVSGPLAGRLLSGQVDADGAPQSLHGNGMCVAEPEFAFSFGVDLPARDTAYTVAEVLAAVSALHPALEVPDSRYTQFAQAGEPQLLADNACAHRFVLGAPATADWRALDLRSHRVTARVWAQGHCRLQREGDGSAVLGDPRVALAWLVNELRAEGIGLAAGQFVTTGTCMVPLAVLPGDHVMADFGVLGQVAAHFTD